jgi:alkylated DNA repair dioxygenase AlkB
MQRVFQNESGSAFLEKGIFENTALLEICISDIEPLLEERPELMIYGKVCKQQRYVAFFSDESIGYTYSRKLMPSTPMSCSMRELLTEINAMLGTEFNGILVNKYMDGNDYISAHSDSEHGLEQLGVVAISYDAERNFRIRNKEDNKIVHEENTTHSVV